jgi:hexaprenyl-diphosphate synthase
LSYLNCLQLVDDVLDYEAGEATLGKPGGADLQLGIATGPALYAWEEHPDLGPLIQRKFEKPGDVEMVCPALLYNKSQAKCSDQARELVRKSSGVERTRDLAQQYADQARLVLQPLPESDAKAALEVLAERVVRRKS